MRFGSLAHLVAGLLCAFALGGAIATVNPPAPASVRPPATRQLSLSNKPWRGDFDGMLERRWIRVLVPYSRTLYFVDKGQERGLTAELVRDFERYVNDTYADRLGKRPLTVVLIPTTRDRLLPDLNAGLGDIAAGNLTVTDERLKLVDFVAQIEGNDVREVVVTGPKSPVLATVDDLAGKTVHVRRSSSYYESLSALDRQFRANRKPPIKLVLLPDALEDEDALEMLNAGLLQILVVDNWKADMWAQVLPNITVHDDLAVRSEGKTGWAIRRNSPQLRDAISGFDKNYVDLRSVAEYRLEQYMRRFRQISNSARAAGLKRFEQTLAIFRQYGNQYRFDPLMLAAQGFQESRLDQRARSPAGAIGIMQITPATGKQMDVGNIRVTESNIHAGAKYMDHLMTRYFPDAHFSEDDRSLFAFASYNAGPANIARMRKEAAKRGLDPNKWFNNVEIVVGEKIGMETTTYVRNIYKYYTSYRLITQAEASRSRAMAKARQ
ncbi:transporter substrate-binding domain-containing protein [Paraburkholderia sp. JHI2823]|uniref:transglycosylase SLT domain-containing protein n=1 Tax=Paraburkholderia TaxID=1822464 RepID=UPI000420CD1F|nr:transporter substrate-binding domain-containing protein [Paraburkholderia mimosarum]